MTKSFFFNFSAIYSPIIVKFGVHLPFSIIYKFCKKDFSLQPPGDPREQHQGDARQRTSSSIFFFFVNQYTGDIYARKFVPTIRRTSGTTSRWRCTRNIVTKSSFFNLSTIYCPIIMKFGGHLPFSIIYKFCKGDFSLQPPREPREQHLGDARQRISS